jgi:hypothetical protein
MASPVANPTARPRVTQRRHQHVDDVALDFADHDRRRGVGEGILRHRHHNEPGREKLDERHAVDHLHGTAKRHREDHQEDMRRHDWCEHGLGVDFQEPADFLGIERPKAKPVDRSETARLGTVGHRISRGRNFQARKL